MEREIENEIWKVYHEGPRVKWEVSNLGNVRRNGILWECRLDHGYKLFSGCGRKVHRAVAELFIPNPENKPEVDHINGLPHDNRACNLRWVTHKENMNNPITRKRSSEAQKNFCIKHPECRKGENNPMYGKKSPLYGKHLSEETRNKMSEAQKIVQNRSETKEKMSKSMKAAWARRKQQKYINFKKDGSTKSRLSI